MSPLRHCDDIIDDPATPKCLRKFLQFHRLPAVCKLAGYSGEHLAKLTEYVSPEQRPYIWTDPEPVLFATVKGEVIRGEVVNIPTGTRVRVVMASRFGDVGITSHLTAERGYDARVAVEHLTDFSESAKAPA